MILLLTKKKDEFDLNVKSLESDIIGLSSHEKLKLYASGIANNTNLRYIYF